MHRPVIGLTTSRFNSSKGIPMVGTTQPYVEAVLEAGGLPILIPTGLDNERAAALAATLDGILFTGGGDVDVRRYNGQAHNRVGGVDSHRDELEIVLAQAAAASSQPFLGICRGAQVVNVALGGTLYSDIADQFSQSIVHNTDETLTRKYLAHEVAVQQDTRLAAILGTTPVRVNSLHHQAVQNPGAGLKVSGLAPDGLVESLELDGHPFGILVQWHPEWLTNQEPMRRLFKAFIEAAGSNGKS